VEAVLGELQLGGGGAGEVGGVGPQPQKGLPGILDGGHVGFQRRIAQPPLEDVGDGQHPVQRRADLVAHHRQELRLGGQGALGLQLGLVEGVGQPGHLLGVGAVGGVGRLQQGQRRADARVTPAAHHHEALHDLAGAVGQHVAAELGHRRVALGDQRRGVHQQRDRPQAVERAAVVGGHGHEEGVALDQPYGTAFRIYDSDGQGVGLALEAVVHVLA